MSHNNINIKNMLTERLTGRLNRKRFNQKSCLVFILIFISIFCESTQKKNGGITFSGEIKGAEKVICAEKQEGWYEQISRDDKLLIKYTGEIVFFTNLNMQFGVDFPEDWSYKATRNPKSGSVKIRLPKLTIISEIKPRIDKSFDTNRPTSTQRLKLDEQFRIDAKKYYEKRAETLIRTDKYLRSTCRNSMSLHYLKILNEANRDLENKVTNVDVVFADD